MTDFIVVIVLALIVGAAIIYIKRAKKKGVNCIGCPNSGNCSGNSQGDNACSCRCGSDF